MRFVCCLFFVFITGFYVDAQPSICNKEITVFEAQQLKFIDAEEQVLKYKHYLQKNRSSLSPDCLRRIYSLIANFCALVSRKDSAEYYFKKAIDHAYVCKSDTAEIYALIDYSRFLRSMQPDSFANYIDKAYHHLLKYSRQHKFAFIDELAKYPNNETPAVFSENGEKIFQPSLLKDMTNYEKSLWRQYYELTGSALIYSTNLVEAEKRLKMALYFDRANLADDNESSSLNNLGFLYQNQGRHTTAVEFFLASIEKCKQRNEEYATVSTLGNIAYSFRMIKRYDVARQYSQQGIEVAKKLNMNVLLCRALSQLASIDIAEQKYAAAEKTLRKSIELAYRIDNKPDLCYSMRKLGNMFISYTTRINDGKVMIDSSAYYAAIIGDDGFMYFIDNTRAKYYMKGGDVEKSLQYAQSSYKKSVAFNDKELILENLNLLYQLYEKSNKPTLALDYFKQYTLLKDSTTGKEMYQALSDIQEKYDVQQKQLAINELKKEKIIRQQQTRILFFVLAGLLLLSVLFLFFNNKLRRQKKELQTTNFLLAEVTASQNRLFGIISHDLKGMIAPFSKAGKIMSNYLRNNGLEQAAFYSKKLEENASRLSETLNNLLHWSLQQMKGLRIQKQNIKLYEIVKHVVSHYDEVVKLKNIQVNIGIPEDDTLYTDKEALQVIIRNLFSNAIKYTESNTINFHSGENGNSYQLIIADKGAGMSEEQLNRLGFFNNNESIRGTQGESGSGLGMVVVHKIVALLDGKLEIHSKLQAGTVITISFKNER